MRRWSGLSLLIAALLLAGCGGRSPAPAPAPAPQQAQQSAPGPAVPAPPVSQTPPPPAAAAGPCSPAEPAARAGMTRVLVYFTCESAPRPVPRLVPQTASVLRAALEELLRGPTPEEQALGFHSFFSAATAGLLRSVTLDAGGRATIDFADLSGVIPGAASSTGGQQLTGELNRTVFQFPAVKEVSYRLSGSREAFWNWLQLDDRVVRAPSPSDLALQDTANRAILALKYADWGTVAALAARQGVRFSPHAQVRTGRDGDLVFSADQLRQAAADQTVYTWGRRDGSGQPITLTLADYWKQFVYDADFTRAPLVQWDRVIGQGTVPDNIAQAYPGARFVEYHFPGFDPRYQGMDWKSLRLVFLPEDGAWRLAGIVHAGWTT